MFQFFVRFIAENQLLTFLVICFLTFLGSKSLAYQERIFGDEDYSSAMWIFSIAAPIVIFFLIAVLLITLVVTLFF